MSIDLTLGTLLVATPAEDADPTFGGTVVLIVDREPSWTITGLVLNRRLDAPAIEQAARAALFLPDFGAPAYWGGPVGHDPVILAELESGPDVEWFHLDQRQRRPFPLPGVGLIALGEHHEPFEGEAGAGAALRRAVRLGGGAARTGDRARRLVAGAAARSTTCSRPSRRRCWRGPGSAPGGPTDVGRPACRAPSTTSEGSASLSDHLSRARDRRSPLAST